MRKNELKVGQWYAWLPDHLPLWYADNSGGHRYVKQVKVLAHGVQRATVSDYADSYYRNDGVRIVQQGNDPETQAFVTHARRFLMPWPEWHEKHRESLQREEAETREREERDREQAQRQVKTIERFRNVLGDCGLTVGTWQEDTDIRIDTDGELRFDRTRSREDYWTHTERILGAFEAVAGRVAA